MKKIILTIMALLILSSGLTAPGYALSNEQSVSIQQLLDDACRISGVPSMTLAILHEDETLYFSSGYADREQGLLASENVLYQLASVSKAFTGVGVLLLEEQGLLSMNEPIQKYLPWLTLYDQGKPVNMTDVTLNHFMYHTSGLTNNKHMQGIPQGDTPDMLYKTVELLINAELEFSPGQQYGYGTINYDVLGLVIEVVSGQSYEDFMREQIFQPLGLHQTYLDKEEAQATGQLAQGYRSSFFVTTPYNAPDYSGNKPAGYIISSSRDMARWMGIQIGLVQDIPEIFQPVIKKSHQGNVSVAEVSGMYYAAGWMVNADQTIIEHGGQNPNFTSEVALLPQEKIAICLLSNGANTNIGLVNSVREILDDSLTQSYKISSTQRLDILLSFVTIIACLLVFLFLLLGLRRRKRNGRQPKTKKRTFITAAWLMVTVIMCLVCWIYPILFGYTWSTMLIWQTYSILTALTSLTLLSACITWFVYAK